MGDISFVPQRSILIGRLHVSSHHPAQPRDLFTGHRISFVRHGGGADLALGEAFRCEFMPGHEAQSAGETGGTAGNLAKRGDDLHVEAARINLTNSVESGRHAKMMQDAVFKLTRLGGVAIEERDLIKAGADGAFEAEGTGIVAGFPNILVTFTGTITSEGLEGYYTLGADGKLPGGQSVTYLVEGTKED